MSESLPVGYRLRQREYDLLLSFAWIDAKGQHRLVEFATSNDPDIAALQLHRFADAINERQMESVVRKGKR